MHISIEIEGKEVVLRTIYDDGESDKIAYVRHCDECLGDEQGKLVLESHVRDLYFTYLDIHSDEEKTTT